VATDSCGDILDALAIAARKLELPEVEQLDPEPVEPNRSSGEEACVSGS
jgi:hypothetical protein